jgi:hypothetical protein
MPDINSGALCVAFAICDYFRKTADFLVYACKQPLLPKSPINAYAAPHRAVRDPVSNATVVNGFRVPVGAVVRDIDNSFCVLYRLLYESVYPKLSHLDGCPGDGT